jgi:hypothetical protein
VAAQTSNEYPKAKGKKERKGGKGKMELVELTSCCGTVMLSVLG